jgi:hypothetical protein
LQVELDLINKEIAEWEARPDPILADSKSNEQDGYLQELQGYLSFKTKEKDALEFLERLKSQLERDRGKLAEEYQLRSQLKARAGDLEKYITYRKEELSIAEGELAAARKP